MKFSHIVLAISLMMIFSLFNNRVYAQKRKNDETNARVQKIRFKIAQGRLTITYDIVAYKSSEVFYPTVTVYSGRREMFEPVSVSGDIDRSVKGGNNKRIIWNFLEDDVKQSELKDLKVEIDLERYYTKSFLLTRHLLLSAVYPGLGDYKIKDKKGSYWIYGAVAYGSVAAALLYNNKASTAYDEYINAMSISESNTKYSNAKKYKTMSYIFAGTAIAIWTVDIVSGIIRINKKAGSYASVNKGFSMGYAYDYLSDNPMVSLKYGF